MKQFLKVLLPVSWALSACASGAKRDATNEHIITAGEIAAVTASNAYEVIVKLRPHFLEPPDPKKFPVVPSSRLSRGQLIVYVNNVMSGGPETLRNVAAKEIVEILYLDPFEATRRTRVGHPQGAVMIRTEQK